MARATGIEIGETAVVVAELDGSPKSFKLVGAARAPIDDAAEGPARRQAETDALKKALKQAKARREQTTLGVRAGVAIIRELVLPFTELEQIKKVIKFESESHLHACDIDDVVVGFQKVGESGGKSRVLIFAVKKDDLRGALEVAARAGVDPLHVTLDVSGLFNLWRALPDAPAEGSQVVLDVGDRTTTVLVATADKLRVVRTVRLGSESITRSVASDLGVDRAAARRETEAFAEASARPFALAGETEGATATAVSTAAELKRDLVRDGHGAFARRLASEILRSVTSVQLEGRIGAVVLSGVGAEAAGLAEALEAAFEVPVRRLDPSTASSNKPKIEAAAGASAAAGLALVGLGHDAVGLDFRQEEFRFARKLDRVKTPLLLGLVFLFVVVAFLSIGEKLEGGQLAARQTFLIDSARRLGRDYLLPLAKDKAFQPIVGQKSPDEWERVIAEATGDDAVVKLLRVVAAAGSAVTDNYGWVPGQKTAAADNLTTSALTRLAAFMGALAKAKDRLGPFTIESLKLAEFEIVWTMDVQESTRWDVVKTELETLEGKPVATRGNDRPMERGMRRLEQCKLEWPRREDR